MQRTEEKNEMPKTPQVFDFEGQTVYVEIDEKGNPYFLAKDVCRILGYANQRDAVAKHCNPKGVAKRDTLTKGGSQKVVFITEGNIYRLVARSNKPEAMKFEEWIFDEVLPTIRKTGKYEMPSKQEEGEDFDEEGNALTMEAATQKLDYEILAAQNFLNLIDKCIDDKLAHFKRKDLNDVLSKVLSEQKNMKVEIMQYIALLADRLHVTLPADGKTKQFASHVYLFRKKDDAIAILSGKHKCKLGKSKDPDHRKFQLEAGGSPLEMVDAIRFQTEAQSLLWERAIEGLFEPYLIDREWYLLEDKHLDFFRALARIIEILYS